MRTSYSVVGGRSRAGRRLLSLGVGLALTLGAAGCGGDPVVMPDVTGDRLDLALSDIERAGVDDEVDVVGGGVFGVLDESNWTVCEQEPVSGSDVGSAPRLVVERECESQESDGGSSGGDGADGEDDRASESPSAAGERPGRERRARKPRRRKPPETFVMPALVGLNLQLGQDVLQSEGSYVLTQTDALGLGRFQVLDSGWQICNQAPLAGVEVPVDTLVDLGVVKVDEVCP